MSFLLPYTSSLGTSTYTIEGLPILGATLLGLASLVVITLAFRRAMATRYALLGGGLVLLASAVMGALWFALQAHGDPLRIFGPNPPGSLESVLLGPMLVEHGAVILAFASVIVAYGSMARERRASVWPLLGMLLACSALPLIGHILALDEMHDLPRGAIAGPPHVHVGKSRVVVPELAPWSRGYSGVTGYRLSASAKEIVATAKGTHTVTIRAVSPRVIIETVASLLAVEERGSPLMELRDGEVTTYAGDKTCTSARGQTTSYPEEFWYSVTSTGERDGLAMFRVDTSLDRSFDAYAADGETYFRHEGPADDVIEPAVKWDRSAGSTCTLAAISISHVATCSASPERIDTFDLSGGTGTAERVVLGLLTLGLHVPEGSTCTSKLSYVGVRQKAREAN